MIKNTLIEFVNFANCFFVKVFSLFRIYPDCIEQFVHDPRVAESGVEMTQAVFVFPDNAAVTFSDHFRKERNFFSFGGKECILFAKMRQLLVRVEDVRILVFPEKPALLQYRAEIHHFLRIEFAG